MKTSILRKSFIIGLALAGLAHSSRLRADTTVVFSGGNASSSVLYDRASNVLSGISVVASNATVRTFTGTIAGQPGLGNVTIHFVLNGAVGGLQDLVNQNSETTATGVSLAPTIAVSSTSPEAVGLSSALLTETKTLVAPYAFIKNLSLSPNLANVTNLTQRQAAYLEGAAGFLPSAFFGGGSTNDAVYLVARNTASAVRTEIDANIFFTGTISTWTTNGAGQPIPDPSGGQSSGTAIRTLLGVITNAIGTVAVQDIKTLTPLSYEGVSYSVTNVENGSYPLWGYEHWFYLNNGQQGAPSPNQLVVINTLLSAVTNATFQTTNPVFVGNFVPYSGMQVQRTADGGPITSLLY